MPQTNQNIGPSPEVLEFFKSKGIKPSYNWKDVFEKEHTFAFTVAKATELQVLSNIKQHLTTAIKEGLPFSEFQKNIIPALKKLGWFGKKKTIDPKTGEEKISQLGSKRRLEVIYSTNMRIANAAGKWERINRTKKLFPYLRYLLGYSVNHRAEHVELEGLIYPVDSSFWDTHYPPNGWNCHCYVEQIMKEEADRLGVSEEQDLEYEVVENPRTGNMERKYKGIDFGFASNAGKHRIETLANYTINKLPFVEVNQANIYFKKLMANKEYNNALNQDYKGWITEITKLKPIGERKIIGILKEEVTDYFIKQNKQLYNNVISITDKVALSALKQKDNFLSIEELENIFGNLQKSFAILFDENTGNLEANLPVKDSKNNVLKITIKPVFYTLVTDLNKEYTNHIIKLEKVNKS